MGASNSAVSIEDNHIINGNSAIVVANIKDQGVILTENKNSAVGSLTSGSKFAFISTQIDHTKNINSNTNTNSKNSSLGYHIEVNEGNEDRGKYVYYVAK